MAEPTAEQITLATIAEHVTRMLALPDPAPHSFAAGYNSACRDIKAIVDMNGRPPNEPVHLGHD